MSTLEQVRVGLGDFWDSVREGWNQIAGRATSAITRFTTNRQNVSNEGTEGTKVAVRNTGWGLLASEVFDGEDGIVVRMEVPGMERDDFDIEVMDDFLTVRGEKKIYREENEGEYRVAECAYGRFERAIPLPDRVAVDRIRATYKDGVLRIEMPKIEKRQRRQKFIPVRS